MKQLGRTHSFINDCMGEVYRFPNTLLNKETLRFIGMNNELVRKTYAGFRFMSTQYGTYAIGERSPTLHRSLEEGFSSVLEEHQNSLDNFASVRFFLIQSVNKTVVDEDLYEILPTGLHQFIEGYSSTVLGTMVPMDKELRAKFINKNQSVILKINEALALNMLLT